MWTFPAFVTQLGASEAVNWNNFTLIAFGIRRLLFLVAVCWAWLLFVVTGNVTRTRASIIPRMGYITGTYTMAQGSSPDG